MRQMVFCFLALCVNSIFKLACCSSAVKQINRVSYVSLPCIPRGLGASSYILVLNQFWYNPHSGKSQGVFPHFAFCSLQSPPTLWASACVSAGGRNKGYARCLVFFPQGIGKARNQSRKQHSKYERIRYYVYHRE